MKKRNLKNGLLGLCLAGSLTASASVIPYSKDITMAQDNTVIQQKQFKSNRPAKKDRLFTSQAVESEIVRVKKLLTNPKLAWMFENCFPNTLDTTVRFQKVNGKPDTSVYTGDIHAMWLRDSGAQVWPYVQLANSDPQLKEMLAGVLLRQFNSLILDPYANAFYTDTKEVGHWASDNTDMKPGVHERKWEIDSVCYPIRLAYHYWKTTGDTSVFGEGWLKAIGNVFKTLH